jgi:WD40 repeat protein
LNFNLSYLAISCYNRKVNIYNISKNTKLDYILTDNQNIAQRVLYLNKIQPLNLILTANYNKIKCWNLESMSQVNEFEGHKGWIYGLSFIEGELFCSSGYDKTIRIWNINHKKNLRVIFAHSDYINCFFKLYDYIGENIIMTGSSDKTMKLIGLNEGTEYASLQRDEEIFLCSAYVNEKLEKISIVTISKENSKTIKIWSNYKKEIL